MARGRHMKRARSAIVVVAIAVGIVLLALGGVSFAAYRYDRASADQILPGVTVAGTDVGGMTRVEAIQAVAARRSAATHATDHDPRRGWIVEDHARRARPFRRHRRRRRSSAPGIGLRGVHHAGLASSPRGARRHLGRRPARRRRDRRLGIGDEHRRRRGPDAAGRIGRRRRRQGDVRPLAAGTRARHPRRGEASASRIGGRHDRRPAAGQGRQAQGSGLEARKDHRRRPHHQPALVVQRLRSREDVSGRHRRRGLRHASRAVDDHRQGGEPDVDEPRTGHVGSRPAGVHPARARQPARHAGRST